MSSPDPPPPNINSISGNAINQSNNKGISNVIIQLTGNKETDSQKVNLQTKTDNNGQFIFNNLPRGTYNLTQYPVTGFTLSQSPKVVRLTGKNPPDSKNNNFVNLPIQLTPVTKPHKKVK